MDNRRSFIDPASLSAAMTVVNTRNIIKNMLVTVIHFSRTVFVIGIWFCLFLDGSCSFAIALTQVIYI
jgi:hypothetical protein